jgi:tetratricopeptide (TPR) repeat protein
MLAVLWASPGLSQSPATAPDTKPIVDRLRAGDLSGALELTQAELRSFPRDCRILSLQGVSLNGLSRAHDALESFRRALAVCPSFLPALEGAAELEYAAGDHAAVPLLNQIVAMRPNDPTSHAMLASLLARGGDCAAAAAHFEASRALFYAQPGLLLEYGSCLARSDRWNEAASAFAELVREHPGDDAQYDLAVAEWKAGNPKDALATLEPLISRETGSGNGAEGGTRALVLGSRICEDAGDTPRAVSLLRSAIVLEPDDVENYLAFARLADAHQSFQVGIDMINAGLTRLPNAAPLYVSRGVLHVQLSQVAEAEADFQHAHQLDPQLSFAMDAIGILQTQRHENAASLALFRQQAKLHPQDPLLQYLLAEALSESTGGDLKEAVTVAKKACALEPDYEPALDLLANLYLRAEQPALADHQADLALARDPKDSIALFAKIRAKHKLGQEAEVPALVKRLELAKKDDLARTQQLNHYRLAENP